MKNIALSAFIAASLALAIPTHVVASEPSIDLKRKRGETYHKEALAKIGIDSSHLKPKYDWAMPAKQLDRTQSLQRITFGSCMKEKDDQSIWNQLTLANADLFLFIGDNVYGDPHYKDKRKDDPFMPKMKESYKILALSPQFEALRATTPMLTTWDDHDYGWNDGGKKFYFKERAQKLFNEAWQTAEDDPRRQREGIYHSEIIGQAGQQVQIILLDTRYFRDDLDRKPRDAAGNGRYIPTEDASRTMLGEAQWVWLQEELQKPADLRLVVSSIQVLADGHGWEAWRTMPAQRQKLYDVISATEANGVVMLSGDRHLAGFYQSDMALNYPLLEVTSSSLNAPQSKWRAERGDTEHEPGPNRLKAREDGSLLDNDGLFYEANFGQIDIDWSLRQATFAVKDGQGQTWHSQTVNIDTLR